MADHADPDDREALWIVRVVSRDDHEAFAALVRLHQSAVRQFLRRLTRDPDRADDLAQETFWKAYRHLGTYAARGRFLSWLFRIAYQEFVTDWRRRRGAVEEALPADLRAPRDSAEDLMVTMTVDRLMAGLRPEERAAVVLSYGHELTHPEIARALDLPLGTVKSLIRRARLRLRHEAGEPADGRET